MKSKENRIGFTVSQQASQPQTGIATDVVLTFDSGRYLTTDDIIHHMLCVGTTGSGKSTNFIFPVLLKLLNNGAHGLLLDIKGNLRSKVRALARACGRENDIVEYGTSTNALALNILAGRGWHETRELLEALTTQNFKNSTQSLDWHLKGVRQGTDCCQLLRYLAPAYPVFVPTLRLVSEMLENPEDAAALYSLFLKKVYNRENTEQRRFVASIDSNRFHIFKNKNSSSSDTTKEEQQSWQLQGIRDGLRNFLSAPGVETGFSSPDAPGLYLGDDILNRKIIILRFDLDTGPIGTSLARMVLSHYYACIFNLGLQLPRESKNFVCIDEFQELADFSPARFSDSSFVAMAREFNCSFIAATQSLAALLARGTESQVMSFASNCNQKIMFYTDDPLTQSVALRQDPDMLLTDLKPGEAFTSTYDARARTHEHGVETLKKAFDSVMPIIGNVPSDALSRGPEPEQDKNRLFELAEMARKETQAAPEAPAPGDGARRGSSAKRTREPEPENKIDRSVYMNDNGQQLIGKFPSLFTEDKSAISLSVPNGLLPGVENVLNAFLATGLEIRIEKLRLREGSISASCDCRVKADSDSETLLNSLFDAMPKVCVVCGKPIPVSREDWSDDDEDDDDSDSFYRQYGRGNNRHGFCPDCLAKYGFAKSGTADS